MGNRSLFIFSLSLNLMNKLEVHGQEGRKVRSRCIWVFWLESSAFSTQCQDQIKINSLNTGNINLSLI